MSAKPKDLLTHQAEETGDRRELYLREGRTLTIDSVGNEELVEVRSSSGQVEIRIRLTEDGPVLQMESVRLHLSAKESVEIASRRVEIRATETVQLSSGDAINVEGDGEVRVVGEKIHLN
jgi:hypothetical protein